MAWSEGLPAMIKKIGPGKYRVRVSVFDPKKGYAVNRERTVSGNLAQAKEKEVELRSQLKHSCSFKGFGHVSTFLQITILIFATFITYLITIN